MSLLLRFLFSLLSIFFSVHVSYADGSKDLYYRDIRGSVKGNRAFMTARGGDHVLYNQAAHYVYVRAHETIAVASSAQGIGNGKIVLTHPKGKTKIETVKGRIDASKAPSTRDAELAGPRAGYDAFEIPVGSDGEGIWKVEFFSTSDRGRGPADVKADAVWEQDKDSRLIAAWDISVRDDSNTYWVKGRVFTHALNLYLTSNTLNKRDGAFYGENYVLTKDGYIYKVDGNGSHGLIFYYFVNSSGILDAAGNPSYKSSNEGLDARFHNPNGPDKVGHITHKMMYTMPDVTMPPNALGAVPDGKTWLYNKIQIAHIGDVSFELLETATNQLNKKGGYIKFKTNYAGRYKVVIQSKSTAQPFVRREIFHDAASGDNEVWWDALDGDGNLLPVGDNYPISVSVALVEGEIHFPYFDMEINPNGIKVERINVDGTLSSTPTMMYWDDSEITPNPVGEQWDLLTNLNGRSGANGAHGWGTYRLHDKELPDDHIGNDNYGAYSFGNDKAMDTWSYAANVKEEIEQVITVQVAELEVVSVQANKSIIELEEEVIYKVTVRNNGPSDALNSHFEYSLPAGFSIINIQMNSICGATSTTTINLVNALSAIVNLPSGCDMTYTITATTGPSVPGESYGYVDSKAGIVRPLGYTDPDATSSDRTKKLVGTAEEECEGECNNIKINREVFLLEPYDERGQMALLKEVVHIDQNNNGFHEAGEVLEYTFTIKNIGQVVVRDLLIEDQMLSSQMLMPTVRALPKGQSTIFKYQYTLKEEDLKRTFIENSAMLLGKNPRGFDVKDVSGTTFENDQPTTTIMDIRPSFFVVKKVINQGTGEQNQFTIGDKIIYQLNIKHEGNVDVEDLQINDLNISPHAILMTPSAISNQVLMHQLEYTVTDEDIVTGYVENTATVYGVDKKNKNRVADISGRTYGDDLPTVTVLAKAPQGVADVFETYQGHALLLDVLANDKQGSSQINKNTIEIVSSPSMGTLVVENNKVRYRPIDNYVYGDDTFVYRFRDNSRLYSQGTEVRVSILRTVPVAVDDYYRLGYNFHADLKLFENDYVEHSSILNKSIQITKYPLHGELRHVGNGQYEYKPKVNFTGYDELKYIIQDVNGNWSKEAVAVIETAGFFFPNMITPNGDLKNDTFEILGTYKFDYIEFEVIDRFGIRVFHSLDYRNDWVVPSVLSEGTYFYIFKGIKGSENPVIRKGAFLIKREPYRY